MIVLVLMDNPALWGCPKLHSPYDSCMLKIGRNYL